MEKRTRIIPLYPIPGAYRPLLDDVTEACPLLHEGLDWGPHHLDLATQRIARQCFFRAAWPSSTDFGVYNEALSSSARVLFWCEPILSAGLDTLWGLAELSARGADLRHAFLVIPPISHLHQKMDLPTLHGAVEERIPVAEVLDALFAVRREIAAVDIRRLIQ